MSLIRAQLHHNEKSSLPAPIIGGGAGGGSLVEIPYVNLDDRKDLVVIYNRVPKTGSTSFINVAYDLCRQNSYHVLHINVTANMHVLSLANQVNHYLINVLFLFKYFLQLNISKLFQVKFAFNVSKWDSIKPALYHGHIAFVDFAK